MLNRLVIRCCKADKRATPGQPPFPANQQLKCGSNLMPMPAAYAAIAEEARNALLTQMIKNP